MSSYLMNGRVSDITEINIQQSKLFFDHRVVGWSMHHRQDPQVVIRAGRWRSGSEKAAMA